MTRRAFLTSSALALGTLLPAVASAATFPFFGPIIPPEYNYCAANYGLIVMVLNRIVALGITLAVAVGGPIIITWSGILLVTSGGSPGARQQAKEMLTTAVVGIVVAISAWMIVDALMAVLYDPSAVGFGKRWTELINLEGNPCIPLRSQLNTADQGGGVQGIADGISYPAPIGTGACDPEVLRGLPGGDTLTDIELRTFACIAKFESACGSRTTNYSWNKPNASGYASSAYGAFQILLSTHSEKFENQVCYDAAGVTSRLNCSTAFVKGFTDPTKADVLQNCLNAASNLGCNFYAAVQVKREAGGFKPWTADINSAKQQQCINNGGTV